MRLQFLLFLITSCLFSYDAAATYRDRISIGAGIIILESPSETDLEFTLEGEHRLRRWIGIGAEGSYFLTKPATTIVGAPEFFLHPWDGDWFISGSPIFVFNSSTSVGVRVGTRVIIHLGIFKLIPSFAVDFINSRKNYLLGAGIAF